MESLRAVCLRSIKRMFMRVIKIRQLIRGISGAQIRWLNPSPAEIVVYDQIGAENFDPYLRNYSVAVLSVRGEVLYLTILVKAMLSAAFWADPLKAYVDKYIQKTSPRLLLTFIDNDPNFYELANKHSEVKTIIVQNGWRNNIRSIFSDSSDSTKYRVDYMFLFGKSIGSFYATKIIGKVIVAGSFKSNNAKIVSWTKNRTVLFLSQISSYPTSEVMFTLNDGSQISEAIYYAAETELLPLLHEWCSINKYKFQICARSESAGEEQFYQDLLKGDDWEYVRRNNAISSYQLVDKSEIVVAIDSTLGLESFGRGNKTAFFDVRSKTIDGWPSFWWPTKESNSGAFWSNVNSYFEVDRILQFLASTDDNFWRDLTSPYYAELMSYDEDNRAFSLIVDSILKNY